ncbi:MAG TPA: hypothetical protein PK253_10135 [Spirochaetota bacterium]|nr:hypothetical protein [Spirochaetota bacterium]
MEQRNDAVQGSGAVMERRDLINTVVRALMGTDEFRAAMEVALPEAAALWAGTSRVKKALAAQAVASFEKGLSRRQSCAPDSGLSVLLEDPGFLPAASREFPSMVNGVIRFLGEVSADIAARPPDEQSEILRAFLSGVDAEKAGKLCTALGRMINGIHENDPLFFSETLRGAVKGLIAGIDFGEVKELVDGSVKDITAVAAMVNEELWRYPAKVVCLFSLIPAAVNIMVSSGAAAIAPMNTLAPDILADVMLSLGEELKGEEIGRLINEVSELVRKLHTGSALIGDQGRPKLPESVSALVENVMNAVDQELLLKAWNCVEDISGQLEGSIRGLLENNPRLAKEILRREFRKAGASLRRWNRNVESLEAVFSDDELSAELAKGMEEFDPQQFADTVNRICALLNRVHEIQPGLLKNILTQAVQSLDEYETGETFRRITEDIVESLKPVAPEVMPAVVRGFADLLRAGDNGSGEMRDALDYLRETLNGREALK